MTLSWHLYYVIPQWVRNLKTKQSSITIVWKAMMWSKCNLMKNFSCLPLLNNSILYIVLGHVFWSKEFCASLTSIKLLLLSNKIFKLKWIFCLWILLFDFTIHWMFIECVLCLSQDMNLLPLTTYLTSLGLNFSVQ